MRLSPQIKFLILPLILIQGILIGENSLKNLDHANRFKVKDASVAEHSFASYTVTEKLKQLSSEERALLTHFFYSLMNDSGGYVLLGNKPMSINGFLNSSERSRHHIYSVVESMHLHNMRIKQGWEVWQKYFSLFPMKNYLLFSEPDFFNENVQFIIFINKKNLNSIVKQCHGEFRKVLGRVVTPKNMIEECKKGKSLLYDILEGHDALLGILLGYGRNNAWHFNRIVEIEPWHPIKHKPFIRINLNPSQGFISLKEELQYVNDKLGFFSMEHPLSIWNELLLTTPGFRADLADPETQQLQKEYCASYHRILRYYKGRDFLEATIEQLFQ